jgi:Protein kinase C terminal domain
MYVSEPVCRGSANTLCSLQRLDPCVASVIYVRTASHFEQHILISCAAPYIPAIDSSNASDTQSFDDTFLDMEPVINDENDMDTDLERDREQTDVEPTDGEDSVATPSQSRSSSAHPPFDDSVDVFDGYSFKGRNSVIIDEEEEVSQEEEERKK